MKQICQNLQVFSNTSSTSIVFGLGGGGVSEGSQLHNFVAFMAGGSAWIDILDMDSMDRSDMLLERFVDHEAWVGGRWRMVMGFLVEDGGGRMGR